MQMLTIQFFFLWLLAAGGPNGLLLPGSMAYRLGDAVDTDVAMDGFLWDALRSQMPKFGINTKVYFEMDLPDDGREYRTFALLFEDGLRSIETRPYQKTWSKEYLERVNIKFIYSKSGTGMIHSVSSTAVYKSNPSATGARRFRVEYEWQEEEAVRLAVGSIVMFLAVFISSIVFLFETCGLNGEPDEHYDHANEYDSSSSSYPSSLMDHNKQW